MKLSERSCCWVTDKAGETIELADSHGCACGVVRGAIDLSFISRDKRRSPTPVRGREFGRARTTIHVRGLDATVVLPRTPSRVGP